jgi:molecular chaperone DnaK
MFVRRSLQANLQLAKRQAKLVQTREFWPLIAGGVAVVSGAVVVHYLNRAANALKSDNQGTSTESRAATGSGDIAPQAFGLDIGSSFSRLALSRGGDLSPLVLENREGTRATASSILFPQGITSASIVDSESAVIGTLARKARFAKPHHAVNSMNLLLGSSSLEKITPEEKMKIYSLLLREMKSVAEAKTEASSVIPTFLSVPNHYDAIQSSTAIAACRNVGLNCISAVPDAVSTALYVIESGQYAVRNEIDLLLLVDVGGQLVQFSIVAVRGEIGSLPYVVAQKTLFDTGGEFYDRSIVNHLAAEFSTKNPGIDLLKDPAAKQRLYDAAEAAKVELSSNASTNISIPFVSADQSGPKHLEVILTRAKMESIISEQTAMLRGPIKELLVKAASVGVAAGGVSAVVVTGGGARMPCIKSTVLLEVGAQAPVITPSEPEETNSIGAASVWALMRGQIR